MAGSELRKHKRVRFGEKVVLNQDVMTRAASLSEGGMFLFTGHPFQKQNEVSVAFTIDRSALSMQGVVRHFHTDVGIGLMFLNPTEAQRQLLAQFVEIAAKTQPETSAVVLLVDNNQVKRQAYKAALSHSGYIVKEADNDAEALAVFKENRVKVVVFDPHIPNGFALLKRIRMSPEGRSVVPIVLSSRPISEDKRRHHFPAVPEIIMKMATTPARLQQIVAKYLH